MSVSSQAGYLRSEWGMRATRSFTAGASDARAWHAQSAAYDTRVLGAAMPYHRSFEEVNLRFYVPRQAGGRWRPFSILKVEL